MPIPRHQAVAFVNRHVSESRLAGLRNSLVTDFGTFGIDIGNMVKDHTLTLEGFQRAWAIHLSRKRFGSFQYIAGATRTVPPRIVPTGGTVVEVAGSGECNAFSNRAFEDLSMNAPRPVPLVEHVSAGKHNLVRVNYSPQHPHECIYVDYWMIACGAPRANAIAIADSRFGPVHTINRTHNPDGQA